MWAALSIFGSLISTFVGFYITGKKSRSDLDQAYFEFARLRGKQNESADERESIEKQRVRLQADREKAQEAALKALDESLAKEAKRIQSEKVANISPAHARAVEETKGPPKP